MFKSDDFPAPEGPIMAVNSPDLNSPDTPLITWRFSERENLSKVNSETMLRLMYKASMRATIITAVFSRFPRGKPDLRGVGLCQLLILQLSTAALSKMLVLTKNESAVNACFTIGSATSVINRKSIP